MEIHLKNITIFMNTIQSIYQIFGTTFAEIKYSNRLSNLSGIVSKNIYDLPFEGNWYVANGGVEKSDSHSWNIIPQRYAYDFVQIDNEMKTNKDENYKLSDYYCYEQNILAPADGVVVELKNKYIDTPRLKVGQVSCNANDIRGNYILIRHSNNEYSLIAHLLKDSFKVEVGDEVHRGMIIALCGNSGNTSEPHIHFHIQNTKSFYSS